MPHPVYRLYLAPSDSLSSSSCCAIRTDIPDPFSPHFSIVHCVRQVFRTTSCISTELFYVGSSWSSCLCSSMWKGPPEYVTYKFAPTSPSVFCMSVSSNLDIFVMGGEWSYSCCFVGHCLSDIFNIVRSILVQLSSSFLSIRFVSVHVVHPYSSIDTTKSDVQLFQSIVQFLCTWCFKNQK